MTSASWRTLLLTTFAVFSLSACREDSWLDRGGETHGQDTEVPRGVLAARVAGLDAGTERQHDAFEKSATASDAAKGAPTAARLRISALTPGLLIKSLTLRPSGAQADEVEILDGDTVANGEVFTITDVPCDRTFDVRIDGDALAAPIVTPAVEFRCGETTVLDVLPDPS